MNFVEHFKICGVDTKQVACIELQGVPNAATEGAVGLLGMDMTSPTHEVYKCVAVNGSIYTWELLSAGMSIVCSTITGEGGASKSFPYSTLLVPDNYLVRIADLILDSEGYLYQISALGADSCDTTYTGNFLGGGAGGSDRELKLKDGQLQLVAPGGTVINTIDYLLPDNATLVRDSATGIGTVRGIYTIGGTQLRLFRGTHEEYDALSDDDKVNLFPIFTDDAYVTQATVDDIVDGTTTVAKATKANSADIAVKATQDGSGRPIASTYAYQSSVANIIDGNIKVGKAGEADSAYKATVDGDGQVITLTYATNTTVNAIVKGDTKVGKATSADSATSAARDGNGNVIVDRYATNDRVDNIVNGTTPVAKATSADSATQASRDSVNNIIATTYATNTRVKAIEDGTTKVGKAGTADSATHAGSADSATKDGNGKVIADHYATNDRVAAIENGTKEVGKATSAGSATKATQDGNGKVIADRYATNDKVDGIVDDLEDGTITVKKATEADSATSAGHAASADTATNANHATSADSAKSAGSATNANYAMRAGTAGSAASADIATKATQDEHGNNIYENYTRNGDTVRYIGDISPNVSTGLYTYSGSFDNIDGKEYSDVIGVSFEIEVTWGTNTRNIPIVAFWGGASIKEMFCYLPFVHYEAVTSSTTYYRPYMICFLLRFMSTAITIPSPILLDLQDVSATSGAASISRSLGKMKKLTVYYK